jgi:peptidoglycan/xylan/chitin deacetylase (PgdA/CDA1 family)
MGNLQTISKGEFGADVGFGRVVDILDEHGVPACFFFPGIVAANRPDLVRQADDAGHEIGNHGFYHNAPADSSLDALCEEYVATNELIEDITGQSPVGLRAASASSVLTHELFDRMPDMGFEYNSNLMAGEDPYVIETRGGDVFELPWHWHMDDAPHFLFNIPGVSYMSGGISSPSEVYDIWSEEFDHIYDEGSLFHLVMHPQIIGRSYRIRMLDDLLDYIGMHDVWFARPRDVIAHVRESDADVRRTRLPSFEDWNRDPV